MADLAMSPTAAAARLRICLVGHTDGPIDEGMKKVAASLLAELSKRHDVVAFNPTRLYDARQWARIRRFRPQLVHYVPGPSWASFPLARSLAAVAGGVPVVMTAIHPKHLGPRWIRRAFRPDQVLVQSPRVAKLMEDVRAPIHFIPLGVDLDRFTPADATRRRELRRKHSIPEDARVALHVGNLKEGRNLRALLPLREAGYEVVVVGSTSVGAHSPVESALRETGVRVITDYLPDVETMYQLADVYVFPVRSFENAIEFPLSVLEAMACNLPAVSTRFGGVGTYLQEGRGLRWLDRDDDLVKLVSELIERPADVKTRAVAAEYSWAHVASLLEEQYRAALATAGAAR